MRKLSHFFLFAALALMFLPSCSQKGPRSAADQKPSLRLINKSSEGKYYTDRHTQAQVFVPKGLDLDSNSSRPNWGQNFLIQNPEGDFKIFVRFDAAKDEEEEAQVCKAALFEAPIEALDSNKLKMFPFLKGEFNADSIVTTDKVYPLAGDASGARANAFQARKKKLGCYTLLFIYGNEASLAQHSTEKEILEYVRFE